MDMRAADREFSKCENCLKMVGVASGKSSLQKGGKTYPQNDSFEHIEEGEHKKVGATVALSHFVGMNFTLAPEM